MNWNQYCTFKLSCQLDMHNIYRTSLANKMQMNTCNTLEVFIVGWWKSWGPDEVGFLWMHQRVPLTTYCTHYSLAFWFFNWVLVKNTLIQGQQPVSWERRSQEHTDRKGENPAFDTQKKTVRLVLNSLMDFSKWSSPQGYWSQRWAVHLNP